MYSGTWLLRSDRCKFTGFGIGAFFSLMSASFAYEDPYLRAQSQTGMNTTQKAGQIFKEMGKGMWTSGKGFGKIGALFAGVECIIESVRKRMSFCCFAPDPGAPSNSIAPKMISIIPCLLASYPVAFWPGTQDQKRHLLVALLLQPSLLLLIYYSCDERRPSMFLFLLYALFC